MNKFTAGMQKNSNSSSNTAIGPQAMLDTILHRESWHRSGGGWIGQAIYGANDGLGSVFGIVSGVAGATAGGPAVLIAGLAGCWHRLINGFRCLSRHENRTRVQEAEIRRESQELESHPEEEAEELALFYQLKGVPAEEAKNSRRTLYLHNQNRL